MKLNWTIALMCVATLTFVACKDKNQPDETSYKIFYVGSDQYINVLANSNNVLTKDDLEGGIIITDAGEKVEFREGKIQKNSDGTIDFLVISHEYEFTKSLQR